MNEINYIKSKIEEVEALISSYENTSTDFVWDLVNLQNCKEELKTLKNILIKISK